MSTIRSSYLLTPAWNSCRLINYTTILLSMNFVWNRLQLLPSISLSIWPPVLPPTMVIVNSLLTIIGHPNPTSHVNNAGSSRLFFQIYLKISQTTQKCWYGFDQDSQPPSAPQSYAIAISPHYD